MNTQDEIKKIIEQFDGMKQKISALDISQSKNKAAIIVMKARVSALQIQVAELEKQKDNK
jgi:hypothetical protein